MVKVFFQFLSLCLMNFSKNNVKIFVEPFFCRSACNFLKAFLSNSIYPTRTLGFYVLAFEKLSFLGNVGSFRVANLPKLLAQLVYNLNNYLNFFLLLYHSYILLKIIICILTMTV